MDVGTRSKSVEKKDSNGDDDQDNGQDDEKDDIQNDQDENNQHNFAPERSTALSVSSSNTIKSMYKNNAYLNDIIN